MRILMMVVATAIGIGVIWPAVSAFGGGGGNEATRLVEATGRAQNKADAVSRSYNDVIPPAIPEAPRRESQPAARQNGQPPAPGSSVGQAQGPSGPGPSQEGKEEEEPKPTPVLSPGEHAVKDAMDLLKRVEEELGPHHTEYTMAVARLKRTWAPRYTRQWRSTAASRRESNMLRTWPTSTWTFSRG